MRNLPNQKGIAHLLILTLVAIGILSFLAFSQAADFRNGIYRILFSKKSSFAADPGVVFVDSNNNPISQTTSSTVKLQLTSPWNSKDSGGFSFQFIKEARAQIVPTATVTLTATNTINMDGATGAVSPAKLWVGNANSATDSWTGFHFTKVSVPKGAIITSAILQLNSSQNQAGLVSDEIRGDNSANSVPFSTSNKPSQRSLTGASMIHSTNSKWSMNKVYDFSDVTPIIQEIISRSDWTSGNNVGLILKGIGNPQERKYVSGSGSSSPKLVISYNNTLSKFTPAPTATSQEYVVSAIIAEDSSFSTNVKNIDPFQMNPTFIDYTFSNKTAGTKTVYVKFISSIGTEKIYNSSIQLGQARKK